MRRVLDYGTAVGTALVVTGLAALAAPVYVAYCLWQRRKGGHG